MVKIRLIGFIAAFALSLAAEPVAGAASAGGPESCGLLALALVDETGSYTRDLPEAVQEAKRVLLRLGPGDCFLARAIRDQSYGANNDIVPLLRLPVARRTIDAGHQRQLLLLKRTAAAALDGRLDLKPAGATDFWQALHAASLMFRNTESRERELHVLSDLKDNQRLRPRSLRLRLDGVKVRLVVPRGERDTPEAFEGRIESWRRVFLEAGATAVIFAELPRARQTISATGRTR